MGLSQIMKKAVEAMYQMMTVMMTMKVVVIMMTTQKAMTQKLIMRPVVMLSHLLEYFALILKLSVIVMSYPMKSFAFLLETTMKLQKIMKTLMSQKMMETVM